MSGPSRDTPLAFPRSPRRRHLVPSESTRSPLQMGDGHSTEVPSESVGSIASRDSSRSFLCRLTAQIVPRSHARATQDASPLERSSERPLSHSGPLWGHPASSSGW